MNSKVKDTIIISLLSGMLLALLVGILFFNKQNQDIEAEKHSVHIEDKLTFFKEVKPNEVDGLRKDLENDIQEMLNGSVQNKFADQSGEEFLRKLFIVTGKPPITDKSSEKEKIEYYKPFTFKLTNFGIKTSSSGLYEALTDFEVQYNGKKVYDTTLTITLNNDKKVTGVLFMQNHEITTAKKAIGILSIIVILCCVVLFQKKNAYDNNVKELEDLKSKQIEVVKNNQKVKAMQEAQYKELGNAEIKEQSRKFFNLFYNWNSWEKYTKNMKEIQKEFPQIVKSSPVDISGTMVGTGNSPISSYTADYYTTNQKGKMVELITQTRNTPTTATTTIWRGVTSIGENQLFYLEDLDSYVRAE